MQVTGSATLAGAVVMKVRQTIQQCIEWHLRFCDFILPFLMLQAGLDKIAPTDRRVFPGQKGVCCDISLFLEP
jgi:hypothetical protein